MHTLSKFNIRVYGLVIEQGKILLTDEHRLGMRMTKFPGGGLKLGEGTIDCLRREFREELGMEIKDVSHFYTTDFFQEAHFITPPQQMLNIYYLCHLVGDVDVALTSKPFDFFVEEEGAQVFRYKPLKELTPDELTLPIDKVVIEKLKERFT